MIREPGEGLVRSQSGSTAIEFAFVAPLLVMFMLGAVQFGTGLHANAAMRELAGWAGRKAVVSYQNAPANRITADQLKADISARVSSGTYKIDAARLIADVNVVQNTSLATVKEFRITLRYTHSLSLPLMPVQTFPLRINRTFFVQN